MAHNINLNSNIWCDVVFEGKNKAYGAYKMRQTASKRYYLAFLSTLTTVSLLVLMPTLLEKTGVSTITTTGATEVTIISDIKIDPPIEKEEIVTLPPPPVPEIRKSIAHTPPTIVDDQTDTEGKEMLSQEELNKDKSALISSVSNPAGASTGIDPAELLGEFGSSSGSTGSGGTPELIPDVPAQFLGGNAELMLYLRDNIRYPQIAIENGIEGRSVIRFVVSIDGNISNIEIIKSSDPSLDKEALRVVKSMPKWVPGKKNGKNVNSYFTLPVTFKLTK